MKRLLVLGVGNILLMDEGIGVHAVHKFLEEENRPDQDQVDFIDGGTFTQDIFYLFENYENILVLDVVRADQPPGTIFSLEEGDLRRDQKQMLSLHDIDLLDSLGMAQMRGHRPYMRVIGIQPEKIDWGTEMTDTLTRALPAFMNTVRKHITNML